MDSATQSKISYGGDSGPFLDALDRAIEPFGGLIIGNAADGSADVEFPNAGEAHRFLSAAEMTDAATLRAPVTSFADKCVVILSLPLFAYRQAVSGRLVQGHGISPVYSLALLKAAHAYGTVSVTVRQGRDMYSGSIVGIGSKLSVQSGGELIEDVPVECVVYATTLKKSA